MQVIFSITDFYIKTAHVYKSRLQTGTILCVCFFKLLFCERLYENLKSCNVLISMLEDICCMLF